MSVGWYSQHCFGLFVRLEAGRGSDRLKSGCFFTHTEPYSDATSDGLLRRT